MVNAAKTSPIELLPDDPAEDAGAAKIEAWFSQLDGDAVVEVYERDGKQQSYLFSVSAEQYAPAELFDAVLEHYGPGCYQVTHRENGSLKYTGTFRVGSAKATRKPLGIPKRDTDERQAPAPPSSGADAVLEAIRATQASIADLVRAMSDRPTPKSTLETLQEFQAMRDLFTPKETPLGEMMSMFRDMLSIKETLLEGDQPDPLTTAIRTLGPAIGEAVQAMRKQDNSRLARIHERAQAEAPTLPVLDETTEQPEGDPVNFMQRAVVGAYLPSILDMADAETEPAEAARRIAGTLAQLPTAQLTAVVEWLNNTDAVDELEGIDDRCKPHREWLDAVIDETLTIFYPTDPDAAGGEGEPDATAAA